MFIRMLFHLPVCRGRASDFFLKDAGKISAVAKADPIGDRRDAILASLQHAFGSLQTQQGQIPVGGYLFDSRKAFLQVEGTYKELFRHLIQGERFMSMIVNELGQAVYQFYFGGTEK